MDSLGQVHMSDIERLLKLESVMDRRASGRSKIFSDIQDGTWIRPIKRSFRDAVWREREVDILIRAEIAGKGRDEIKALVKRLEADRVNACAAE